MEKAIICDGWVICPLCRARQFPIGQSKVIDHLKYRCRTSRKKTEHFMLIDFNLKE